MFALAAPFKDVCHSNVDTANYRVGNMKVGGNGGVVSQPPGPFLLSSHCEIFISRLTDNPAGSTSSPAFKSVAVCPPKGLPARLVLSLPHHQRG